MANLNAIKGRIFHDMLIHITLAVMSMNHRDQTSFTQTPLATDFCTCTCNSSTKILNNIWQIRYRSVLPSENTVIIMTISDLLFVQQITTWNSCICVCVNCWLQTAHLRLPADVLLCPGDIRTTTLRIILHRISVFDVTFASCKYRQPFISNKYKTHIKIMPLISAAKHTNQMHFSDTNNRHSVFRPRRRVEKSHFSCSCHRYQFSKNPHGFLNTQWSTKKLRTHIRADIPHRSTVSDFQLT